LTFVKKRVLLVEGDSDHADLIINALNEEAGSICKEIFLIKDEQDTIEYFCKKDFPEYTCQVGFNSDA